MINQPRHEFVDMSCQTSLPRKLYPNGLETDFLQRSVPKVANIPVIAELINGMLTGGNLNATLHD